MNLFLKLGNELRDLFKDLFHPEKRVAIEAKIEDILKASSLIGGQVAEEAKKLAEEVRCYLKDPKNKKWIHTLKQHAMHLEQQTRDL